MDRDRIQADLRGLLEGEVRCDDAIVQLYASDASIYEIQPAGVVRPRGSADVVATLQYAAENGLPVHARGAGTGLAGESLGGGLVMDFSHAMRRIIDVGDRSTRVQSGVVLAQLNRHLRQYGKLFGPDPATRSVTTMGSVVALDASGSHWLQYGSARSRVLRLDAVLADGERFTAAKYKADDPQLSLRVATIVRRLAELLRRHKDLIEQHRPRTAVNRSGYHVWDVLDEETDEVDLVKLLVGSEGTLAVTTEAELALDEVPRVRGLAMLLFDRLEAAANAAAEVTALGASTCDLMDRRLMTIAREHDARYVNVLPADAEALLLVEVHGDDSSSVRDQLQQITTRLMRKKKLAFDSRITLEREDRNFYWRLARRVIPTLYRLEGNTRPLPFIEDIAVPPAALADFLTRLQNVLKAHEVTASLFGHAGHGQLHIRPFLDLSNADDVRRMHALASDLYSEVLDVGGSVSGEHGDGLSRTWFLRRQFGDLYEVFREIKRIFDPQNLLNPGKIVTDAPQPLTSNLRPVATAPAVAIGDDNEEPANVELQLLWSNDEMAHAARACNGCGRCRTQAPEERMCPIFRFAPREESSPRAKANLVRAVLTGRLPATALESDEIKELADLCVNCHQCRLECPAQVDIPKLVLEAKSQYVATNGMRLSDWLMTRLDGLASWALLARGLANWSIGNRQMRWLLEKTMGVAQGRKLPRLAARPFMRTAQRRRLNLPRRAAGQKVVYFVDTYANWFDTQLSEALVAVMEHNGVTVFVAPGQLSSGMSQVSLGALEAARKTAEKNVAVLADTVRQGYQVVTTEPAAALCLTHEYLNLLDDDDARLVAGHTTDACDYLWKMHQVGKLELDLKPINMTLGYHLPCHLRALDVGAPGYELLRLIPGLTVQDVERGCSGMAGTFGLTRKNYRSSLRAGWGLISSLREPAIQVGVTECSACKIQMEQGASKPTVHPLKVLALAYGLMPEISDLLTSHGQELIVT